MKDVLKTAFGKWAVVLAALGVLGAVVAMVNGAENITEVLIGAVLLLIIAAVLFLVARNRTDTSVDIKKNTTIESTIVENRNTDASQISFRTSVSSSSYNVEMLIADGCEISVLYLDGYKSQSGGFGNWTDYKVSGTNPQTKRKNTRRYAAKNEDFAAKLASEDGLVAPYEIEVTSCEPPTENQVSYLRSWGCDVPHGASKYDVSAILSRLADSRDIVSESKVSGEMVIQKIRPLKGPNEEFAKYADDMGIRFSRYIGDFELFDTVVGGLGQRDKAAFFAYCVLCSHNGSIIADPRKSPYADRLLDFADTATSNDSIMRSIEGRNINDYRHPHKGSAAYKAVAEYFGIK